MQKSAEDLRELGLEPLEHWGAARGPYEEWLAAEGVRVVFLYDPPHEEKIRTLRGEVSFFNADWDKPWVPPWVNVLGRTYRGQRLTDAVRRAVREDPLGPAVAAAFAMGGQRAVETLLLVPEEQPERRSL